MSSKPSDDLILNVDDTEAARYMKTRLLSRAGFEVIEAATGTEALALAHSRKPALVLLDVKLPDISGYEVTRILKEDPQTQMILILQTSASFVATENRIQALDNGADNYLAEPMEPDELIANVRALLRLARVERELREVARRKDEFLAVLAHELRNPLAPIKTAVELLREMRPDVPQQEEAARNAILRQSEHMVRLVDDLLDVARISRGQIRIRDENVPLTDAVRAAMETASVLMESRQHRLIAELPEHEMWIRGDHVRVAQAVSNLLNNAAKFTPPGGEVRVSLREEKGRACITVCDNGIGIAPEQQQRIFQLFAQAGHSEDRVQDGLGIGLFLVKTLVEMQGGEIEVSSNGRGSGSCFSLHLPLAAAPDAQGTDSVAPLPMAEPGQKVMVVDDNVDAAHLICSMLEIQGYEVEEWHDGRSAITAADMFRPDIIVLDLGLPDMSGLEVARSIRELPAMRASRIIALSGYGQERDKESTREAGFDLHLTKPITFEQLARAMKTG